jgi:HEAT repeat protein
MKSILAATLILGLTFLGLLGGLGATEKKGADLLNALKDKDSARRAQAALDLALPKSAATADAIPALIDALKDKEDRVRAAVAQALYNRLGSVNLTPELQAAGVAAALRALGDNGTEVRIYAVKSLGIHLDKDKNRLAAVRKVLREDKEPTVRAAAEIALGNIGPTANEALPELLRAAKDSDAEVRTWSVAALQSIVGSDTQKRRIEIRDKAVIQTVLEALKDDAVEVRRMAFTVMPNLKAADALPALIQALKDADAGTRANALFWLARRGSDAKDALPAIKPLLKDEDNGVREQAKNALQAIQGKKPDRKK